MRQAKMTAKPTRARLYAGAFGALLLGLAAPPAPAQVTPPDAATKAAMEKRTAARTLLASSLARIASNNSGGLGYQFGAFYFDEKLDISSFEFGGPTDATPSAIAVQRQDSEAYGLFGSVNYAFDNGFKLQAGARYNHDTRDFVASRPVETRPDFVVNPNTPVPPQAA